MSPSVRVIPNSARTGIAGMRDGRSVLGVEAPAVGGRANRAAVLYLAKLFGVRPFRVSPIAGEKGRHKKFEIVGYQPGAESLLDDLLKTDS